MKKTLAIFALATAVALPASAAFAGPQHVYWDRVEDRLDRAESWKDRQVTHGPRDRIEDRTDRWEDRRDRADKPVPRYVNRWERNSIRKRW